MIVRGVHRSFRDRSWYSWIVRGACGSFRVFVVFVARFVIVRGVRGSFMNHFVDPVLRLLNQRFNQPRVLIIPNSCS